MKPVSVKHLWSYPVLFGFFGVVIGLVLRYAYIGELSGFPLKNVLHSHSHVMLLGFLFNALVVLLWKHFTSGIDKRSYHYYLALQVCVFGMLVMFIVQGYALFSILFSTLHLWISYVFLIRLWKRINRNNHVTQLVKVGIVFHFVSSIGSYCLGPLMALNMQESPWYQQAIFFYLHFQYFGSLFIWLLAILIQRSTVIFKANHVVVISIALIGLYAHSLNFSFNHWSLQLIGLISSVMLFIILLKFIKAFLYTKKPYRLIYGILLCIAGFNIIGNHSFIINHIIESRHFLIAWLHLLFLGLFVPFIWVEMKLKINKYIWVIYSLSFLFAEAVLVFPNQSYMLLNTSVMKLLFIGYLGVFFSMSIVHLKYLFKSK